jgi:hypothetical protein
MNILILSALLLGGCKTTDPIATPLLNTDYSIVDGDTIKTVVFKDYKKLKDKDPNGKNYITVGDTIVLYKEPKLHTPPAKDPDLSKLKNNDDPDLKGKPLRMVAIGGSLTAGVRDGGYFNEGILTSYPNLIARQMKLKKFEQPLFDATDYNGFGRKVRTSFNPTGGPVPKFNEVKNNSGVEAIVETTGAFDKNKVQNVSLKKYKSYQTIDNWAVPNLSISTLLPSGKISGTDFYKDNKSFKASLERVAQDYDKSFSNHVFRNKFDFFIYEVGWEDILGVIFDRNNTYNMLGKQSILPSKNPEEIFKINNSDEWYYDPAINGEIKFLKQVANNKVKYACFLNLPPLESLPYFKIINQAKQQEILSTVQKSFFYFTNGLGTENSGISLLPTSEVDSLYSTKVHIALKKGFDAKSPLSLSSAVYGSTISEAKTLIKSFNNQTAAFSKIFNAPLVDMYGLYEKILSGNYSTDDGVRVDGSYPNGNFFSSDGIYPTAFGQSIIANEVIKAINAYYKTEIPLIPTREYLNIK